MARGDALELEAITLDEGTLHLKDGSPYLDEEPLTDQEAQRLLLRALNIVHERAGRAEGQAEAV